MKRASLQVGLGLLLVCLFACCGPNVDEMANNHYGSPTDEQSEDSGDSNDQGNSYGNDRDGE